jgi:hypothetical protein
MNRHRNFLLLFLGLLALNSLSIGAINAFVDPYNVVNSQTLAQINLQKPQSSKDTRRFKAINVIRFKPKTIFLGNSRTDIGLDPAHPALASYGPVYNLAIPAGDMYESMRYFQHALANQPDLKQVVIGVDLVAFETRENIGKLDPEQEARLGTTSYPQHLPSLLFSTDMFSSSFSTVSSNLLNKPAKENYLNNGRLIRTNPNLPIEQIFRLHLKTAYFDGWYDHYQMSPEQLKAFQVIVETCKAKGIDLKVFISPAHVTQMEAKRAAQLWPAFEAWKRELVKITPVWDFSGYNSITTEPLTEEMQNYLESSHYVKEIGDLVLNRLFDDQLETVPSDFGVLVTSENIESHLAQIRAQRQVWATQNPEVVELVQRWSQEP